VDLEPANFTTNIDNRYWPMVPGTRWTYSETDQEGAELEVVVTVTEQTKKIANGITARVVRDTVTEDGELAEDTFDWYAHRGCARDTSRRSRCHMHQLPSHGPPFGRST
jgi:hypothetical protein